MTWLAWRQFRTAALAVAAVVAVVLGTLAATGPHVAHLYSVSGLGHCGSADVCAQDRDAFFGALKANTAVPVLYFVAVAVLYLVPALLGLFWGAPLVSRETEAGTLRVAWTQSVTRWRWLGVKLAVGATAAVVVAGLLSVAVTWWSAPVDRAAALPGGAQDALPNHFNPLVFGARGAVPVAVAVFGFLAGAVAGLLLRRILPALAATLVVLVVVQSVLPMAVRRHYATPDRAVVPLVVAERPGLQLSVRDHRLSVQMPVDVPGAWVTSVSLVDGAGRPFQGPAPQECEGATDTLSECFSAINALHLQQAAEYQPGERFGRFQGEEAAVYAVLSLVLAGVCLRRVRRMSPV